MTHEYTLLVGAVVLPGADEPEAAAIAWAHGTVLAIGSEAEVSAISRGDSHVLDATGGYVVPIDEDGVVRWPSTARIEVGGTADLAVLESDPRLDGGAPLPSVRAILRGGHVVSGWIAALDPSLAALQPPHSKEE